ncbi:hypothetical protein BDY17DRAFT_55756 [Neohortaea acidophila]|uniref:Peptidase M43 pregnancy-associated plasma-A domain-containing protein n=1 Tax=Neohortaea acidophila TaxID=245834 RepID=A0A6A6PF77_9PEZI|nr:uncharacterized protein BDY17DRAFT_55756 [Neohortaea acidophila]KAF2478639.1 hypothetical protein BDY17DRAFT_55756 [Neohortaea acidophila]
MKTFTLLSAATAALASLASASTLRNATHFVDQHSHQIVPRFGCDVDLTKASEHFKHTIARMHSNNPAAANHASALGTRAPRSKKQARKFQFPLRVPTYFHIISTAAHNGSITPKMVSAQLGELNKAYNPYGISFDLKATTWTVNDAWATTDLSDAQNALRQGTYDNLNIYFHTDLSGGLLGTCTLPAQLPSDYTAATYIADGCDVNANTMPGGSFYGYNLGKTAVHETGHWLGLLHTFEGYSCSGPGDYVADTRVEEASTDGCPTHPPKNSCPGVAVAGADPIHNYMDYSTDACYESFTAGQIQRVQELYGEYRAGH